MMKVVRWLMVRVVKISRREPGCCGGVMVVADKHGVITVPCLQVGDHPGNHVFSIRKNDELSFPEFQHLSRRTAKILSKGGIEKP